MKEYHRLLTGEMVRAIIEGRKTQTRVLADDNRYKNTKVGDRLWVREAWNIFELSGDRGYLHPVNPIPKNLPPGTLLAYAADRGSGPWRPSMHMPRWACRLLLKVTGVREEPLRAISTEDIIAEGLSTTLRGYTAEVDLKEQFIGLWDSLYGKTRPWASNPMVKALDFEVMEAS
ncbi:conserved hypothetical protein [Desulfatibacillum aliphaticivorans]|uniref:ASCH domain-containing protein n=1 Tax=Desulfatibacillum aliphaticivorans TaxID=218208 RepID=B8FNK8_DESAL|nr:hypothetical protein [Desulfatibacillum aliphaticivorans]ACL06289.1 conserved hypothetical protein [Desulfatibacillum aliphaticivorans]